MTENMKNPKLWLLGLAAASISGAVNCSALLGADMMFNLQIGWKALAIAVGVSALTGAVNYMRRSPIPWDDIDLD